MAAPELIPTLKAVEISVEARLGASCAAVSTRDCSGAAKANVDMLHMRTSTVADNGPGIPKSDINKVFEKFYRAEGTSTGGTGLGLPIAKGFVEAHKGNLSVRNRVSGGTEFKIEIPIEGEAENR